ncbi:ABC transporter permease [Musicola paradisiaca]|nr:ABC transporter permease subunit [Musicola paradisiaca]
MTSGIWRVSSSVLACMLLFPMGTVAVLAWFIPVDTMGILWRLFPAYGLNSVLLALGCMVFSLLFALPLSWGMARYRFIGQRWLHRGLLLPLAMPAYLLAAIYSGVLGYDGPVSYILQALKFDVDMPPLTVWQHFSPIIRSSLCLALVLFPSLYLLVRTALMTQHPNLHQTAQLMHHSPVRIFWRISLPLCRPAMLLGMVLVASESLGDYGVSAYFSLQTLTTAGLDLWRDKEQHAAAAAISAILLPAILALWLLAQYSRTRQLRYQMNDRVKTASLPELSGWRRCGLMILGWGLVGIAFIIPVFCLLYWSVRAEVQTWNLSFLLAFTNSAMASTCSTLAMMALALLCIFDAQSIGNIAHRNPLRLLSINRLIPGTVLGMGVLVPFLGLDLWLSPSRSAGESLWAGSILVLIIAYCMRFSGLLIDRLQLRMRHIPSAVNDISRSMGYTPAQRVWWVYLPQVRYSLIVGVLLVFCEGLRELNIALLMQPFNVETMAAYVFRFIMDERLDLVASPALMVVGIGILPLLGLIRLVMMEE